MGNLNKRYKQRNEHLEVKIKNVEKLYEEYKASANEMIKDLTENNVNLGNILGKLKKRNFWQRILRKHEDGI